MKVLSIKEPFASLICLRKKRIETRSFKTNYRGKLYIHASLKNHVKDDKYEKIMKLLPKDYEFQNGYIICECNLADCIYMDDEFLEKIKKDETEYSCGRYEKGRYAWIITDVKKTDRLPAKGKLGIWNY